MAQTAQEEKQINESETNRGRKEVMGEEKKNHSPEQHAPYGQGFGPKPRVFRLRDECVRATRSTGIHPVL